MVTIHDIARQLSKETRVHERQKAYRRVCRKLGVLLADRIMQINELSEIKPENGVPSVYPFARKGEGQNQNDIGKDPRVHAAALYMVYTIIELLQESFPKKQSFTLPLVTFRSPIYYDFMLEKILRIILEDSELCRICRTDKSEMEQQLMVITSLERGLPEVQGILTTSASNFNLPIRNNDSTFVNDPRKMAINDSLLALCPILKNFPDPYFPFNAHRMIMESFARKHPQVKIFMNRKNTFYKIPTDIPHTYVEFKYLTKQCFLLGVRLVSE